MNEIERMQEHLTILRKSLGFTQAEFADELEITRTYLSNLENKKYPMRKVYYLAISKLVRDVLENDEHELSMARILIDFYIEEPLFDSKEEYDDILGMISMLCEACVGQKGLRKEVEIAFRQWMQEANYNDFY